MFLYVCYMHVLHRYCTCILPLNYVHCFTLILTVLSDLCPRMCFAVSWYLCPCVYMCLCVCGYYL